MRKRVAIFCLVLLNAINILADNWMNYANNYSDGKEFYVTFMNASTQAGAGDLNIALFMAARQPAFVTIQDANTLQTIDTFTITAAGVANSYHVWTSSNNNLPPWFLTQDYYCAISDSIFQHTLLVTSTSNIALYMATSASLSGDASLVLPTNRLGKEYVIQTPTKNGETSEFSVVATQDNTTITITPSDSLNNAHNGIVPNIPYNKVLNKGEVYFVSAYSKRHDLSGTTICSDKDIMVFNGSQSMSAEFSQASGHVVHEAMPTQMWGKKFPIVIMSPQDYNVVKLTASDQVTHITRYYRNNNIDYVDTFSIQPFKSDSFFLDGLTMGNAVYVEATYPISCYQYMLAKTDQSSQGRTYVAGGYPAVTSITSVEQGVNSVMFSTFQYGNYPLTYYVNIVCPTASISRMFLDGVAIPSNQFEGMPGMNGYSYVSKQIANGAHQLTNSSGEFTAIVYGLTSPTISDDWSYAYNAGMNCQHQDVYLLIDGVRTNEASKCKNNNSQWIYDFAAVLNLDYDSIAWYYDKGRMSNDSSFTYTFNYGDSLRHPVYLYVYRKSAICNYQVVDTIVAGVNNAMTYNINRPVEYYCKGDTIRPFEGTQYEQEILANTLTTYRTYSVQQRFDSESGCDSIVRFNYQVLDPKDVTQTVHICQGKSFTYQGVVMTEPSAYPFDEYEHDKCHYIRTFNVVVDPVYDVHVYDTICDIELPYLWRHSKTDVDTIRSACADYVRTLKTKMGCDSSVHLHLTVGRSFRYPESVTVCDVDLPYLWHGQTLTESGTYHDNNKTIYGCDSNYTIVLTVNPTYLFGDTVSICGNSSYTWRNRVFTKSGLYYDSLLTEKHCDSVYFLMLNVDSMYYFPYTDQICQNEPYTWRGQDISTDQIGTFHYRDSLQAVNGCDSIYHLMLTVHQKYLDVVERKICQGETYEFAGNQNMTWMNNVVGNHRDTVYKKSVHNCDSTLILDLSVYPVYNYDAVGVTCPDAPYHWVQGDLDTLINQTNPGIQDYYVRNKTSHGCDSVYHLSLTVNDVIIVPRTAVISDRDSLMWDNMVYAGTKYYKSTPDSIINTSATPYVIDHHYTSVISGCDSIMRLIVTVCPTYEDEEHATTCQYESYPIEGHSAWTWRKDIVGSHDTTYIYQTAFGFDSVRNLYLTVYPVYYFKDTAYTCCNEEYVWEGHAKNYGLLDVGPHTLFDSLKTVDNCDSIYERYLIVQDTIIVPENKDICDIDTFSWDGTVFSGEKYNGTAVVDSVLPVGKYSYRRRYTSSIGCDSFMTLVLNIHPTYELYDTVETCQGESYHPNGEDPAFWTLHKDTAGVYDNTFRYSTVDGCDSVRHLHLTVHPEYSFEEYLKTCCNNDFVWPNHDRIVIGRQPVGTHIFIDSLFTVGYNCDSVHILHLEVQDTIKIHKDKDICDIDTFTWDHTLFAGEKYLGTVVPDSILATGTYNYRNTYLSATNCDSFMTLTLRIHPTYELFDSIETCQGENYHPNGEDPAFWILHKDTAGVYDNTFRYSTVDGCDSVRHLHLTVHPEYSFEEYLKTCCNNDFVWPNHDRIVIGRQPVGTHIFIDSLFTVGYNCDSVHILHLEVQDTIIIPKDKDICDIDTFSWDGIVFSGEKYNGTAVVDSVLPVGRYSYRRTYPSSTGCDSFMTLVLNIHPTYELYDTVETCQRENYHPNDEDPAFWSLHKDTAGVYDDTFRYSTVDGCDSVRHLHLVVHPEYYIYETDVTCSNTAYVWQGHDKHIPLLGPGTYTFKDSLFTAFYGCDSVHELTLTVIDTIVNVDRHSMCDNESYTWDGQRYAGNKFPGFANVTVAASSRTYEFVNTYTSVRTGCDSVERLLLTVYPTFLTVLPDDSICQGETYHFSTKFIPCNNIGTYTYYDTLQSIHGCDSIVKIRLRVDEVYEFVTRETICDNIHWTWRGHTFDNVPAGDSVIVDNYLTVHGCDSTYILYLKSISSYLFEDAYEMCDYDTTVWRSHTYYGLPAAKYVYYDSLKTLNGCDSVYKLTLTVHPHYYIHDTLTMCDNETIQLRHHTLHYPVTGHYTIIDSLNSVYNCDSIIETAIFVYPTYLFTDEETICSNDSLLWRRKYYKSVSGIFYDSLKSSHGCDSVYKLIFHVIPAYKFETTVTICSNESYYFQGQNLRDEGDHHFMYYTVNGCDSEYVLHLNVLPAYFINTYETICSNETYNFRGRVLNQPGVYYDSLRTQSGCDSVFVLHLTVHPAYHTVEFDNDHCEGDVVMFHGQILTSSGIYFDSLKTYYGCDSVFEFRLNMMPTYLFETDTAVCDYKPLKWRGNYYSVSGVYYDSLQTKAGCDSVYVLYLQVSPTDYDTIDTVICLGDTYMLGSQACTTAGTYHDTISIARDFNCRVTVLNLETMEPTVFQTISNPDICADDSMFVIPHRLLGEYPETYSVLFDDAAKAQGFKDVIEEPYRGVIEVPVPECIREEWYVRPDNYQIVVRADNGICDPEKNEYHGTLMVRYPSWVIEQRWNDVVAALNEYFNGNYKFSNYEWVVNGDVVQAGSLSYIYLPGRLSFGDIVYARLTRQGEAYSIETCPIVIYDRTDYQTTDFHVIITGTPEPHGALQRIRLYADVDGRFFISDVSGKVLMNGQATADMPVDLDVPYPAGVYFLYYYVESGEYKSVKFIVQ